MKRIFRITYSDLSPKTGEHRFINFECSAPSVGDLTRLLADGGLVLGSKLFTVHDGSKVWRIVGRKATSISKAGITMIEEPQWKFIEAEPATA